MPSRVDIVYDQGGLDRIDSRKDSVPDGTGAFRVVPSGTKNSLSFGWELPLVDDNHEQMGKGPSS